MKTIIGIIFLGINLIFGALLGGSYSSGGITLDKIYISIFCLNLLLLIIFLFLLYIKNSNQNLKDEIEKNKEIERNLSTEERQKKEVQKKEAEKQGLKEFEEGFKGYIQLGIGLGILALVVNYWDYILGFFIIIISLIFGALGGILEGLTSTKGLLVVIVILLILIINKLNNKN